MSERVAMFGSVSKEQFELWFNQANPPIEEGDVPRVFNDEEWLVIACELESAVRYAVDDVLIDVMRNAFVGVFDVEA